MKKFVWLKGLTSESRSQRSTIFWFSLSLTFAAVYGLLALPVAFGSEYVVQDDARQHVFWAERFADPGLFPNDLIADYYRSLAPAGYAALYQVAAWLGLKAEVFSKVLPVFLSIATAACAYWVAVELLPVPIAGFITSLLLNQNLWLKDDLASATPRAFLYPLALLFLGCVLRRAVWPCLGVLLGLVLFYPTYILIAAGLLALLPWRWQKGQLRGSGDRRDIQLCLLGLALCVGCLLPYLLTTSEYGPTTTAAIAQTMPEFLPKGRTQFFLSDPLEFWLWGGRGSLLPKSLFTPLTTIAGLLLPGLLWQRDWFPLARSLRSEWVLLPQMLLVSCGWWLLAHWLLFKLYLPSRYTWHSFSIGLVLAAGIALTLGLDALLRWARSSWQTAIAVSATGLLAIALLGYPSLVKQFPITGYLTGQYPQLYRYFAQQPKNSLIASLSEEANNLPTFARRSVLVSSEYALPYQMGYYRQIRQRTIDLIRAQYSADPIEVRAFIQKYGVDFWLLDRHAFQPGYLTNSRWLKQYQPVATDAEANLQQNRSLVVLSARSGCTTFETEQFVVLDAACMLSNSIRK